MRKSSRQFPTVQPRTLPSGLQQLARLFSALCKQLSRVADHLKRMPHDYKTRRAFQILLDQRAVTFLSLYQIDPARSRELEAAHHCSYQPRTMQEDLELLPFLKSRAFANPALDLEPSARSANEEKELTERDEKKHTGNGHTAKTKGYQPWYAITLPVAADKKAKMMPLVVKYPIYGPSIYKLDALAAEQLEDSEMARRMLDLVQSGLDIARDEDERVLRADLTFLVNEEKGRDALAMVEQKKVEDGKVVRYNRLYSNSYQFVAARPSASQLGLWEVTSRLADQRTRKDEQGKESKYLAKIPGKFFQGLLVSYMFRLQPGHEMIADYLVAGVCQEVADQILSHIQLVDDGEQEAKFPTIESRNPAKRLADHREALDGLVATIRPLDRMTARDLNPKKYGPENPRGRRLVFTDERWQRMITSAGDPKMLTLFFMSGMGVRVFKGETPLPADITRRSRHSPPELWRRYDSIPGATPSAASRGIKRVGPYRLVKGEIPRYRYHKPKTSTLLRQYYAAVPLPSENPAIAAALTHRGENPGRNLDLTLTPVPLHGNTLTPKQRQIQPHDILLPLQMIRDRSERILNLRSARILVSRLVRKPSGWKLQLTIGVSQAPLQKTERVLGVAFGLDAIAAWCLRDTAGNIVEEGQFAPNPQIAEFLRSKIALEWDQKKGRFIGGRQFAPKLKTIADQVANKLLALAAEKQAVLAVEEIRFRPTRGKDPLANILSTAWNSGQQRRILAYKAKIVGRPFSAESGYRAAFTCPGCGNENCRYERGELCCGGCDFRGKLSAADKARTVSRLGVSRASRRPKS